MTEPAISSKAVRSFASMEVRRRLRSSRSNTAHLAILALTVPVVIVGASMATFFGGYIYGQGVRNDELTIEAIRGPFPAIWASVLALVGYRAYSTLLQRDNLDGLLTTTSHRTVICGLVLTEAFFWTVFVGPFVLVATLGYGIGTVSLLVAGQLLVALSLTIAMAIPLGIVLALAVQTAGLRHPALRRLRTALIAALAIAYFGLIVTASYDQVYGPLITVLGPTPLGWLGEFATVGIDRSASPWRAIAAVAFALTVTMLSVPALFHLSATRWYADGSATRNRQGNPGESATLSTETPPRSRLDRILPSAIVGVVLTDLRRARRAPVALSFVLYPALLLLNPVASSVREGAVTPSLALWVLFCGAWMVGAAFTLNVLGQEGGALQATILSPSPGRTLVCGHVVSGLLVGLPVVTGSVAILAWLGGHGAVGTATLVALAGVCSLVTGPLATGIGAILPRFNAVSLTRRTEVVIPSTLAFAVYSTAYLVVVMPAVFVNSSLGAGLLDSAFAIAPGTAGLVGLVWALVVGSVLGGLSLWVALWRVENYEFT